MPGIRASQPSSPNLRRARKDKGGAGRTLVRGAEAGAGWLSLRVPLY
jgi:hypothetical protein